MAERLYPNATLFIEIAIFVLLLLVLSRFLFKPVLKVLCERKKRIEGTREEIVKLKEEVKAMLAKYEIHIASGKEEARQRLEALKREGEELAKAIVEKAKVESEKHFQESNARIHEEVSMLRKKLDKTAEEISDDLASKIFQ